MFKISQHFERLLSDYLIWLLLNGIDNIYIYIYIKDVNEIIRMLLLLLFINMFIILFDSCAFEIISARIK